MIADRLRAAVLQAAICGQLTEQRPEDGTAAELLDQITAEKNALVKAGKLKKHHPLPPVTEDEQPFDIPGSWEWARLAEICSYVQRGRSPKYTEFSDYVAISQKCVQWDGFKPEAGRPYLPEEFAKLSADRLLSSGDLLWNSTGTGTVGRAVVVPEHPELSNMAVDSHVTVIRTWASVNSRYLWIYVSSPEIQEKMDELTSGTTKQKELNLSTILLLPVPIPPITEQERIVAKLDALMPLIDQLAELEREREHLDREFFKALEGAILQAATQGKLTLQHPEDGTAAELLEQITAEKKILIEAGKLKKPKPLPPVTDNEQLYDIPDTWRWVRLGVAINLLSGRDLANTEYFDGDEGTPYITGASNFVNGEIRSSRRTLVPSTIARQGDLLITVKGTIGELAFLQEREAHIARQVMAVSSGWLHLPFIEAVLSFSIGRLKAQARSMIPGIDRATILKLPIPLPPVAEQERIVAKLDAVMPLVRALRQVAG